MHSQACKEEAAHVSGHQAKAQSIRRGLADECQAAPSTPLGSPVAIGNAAPLAVLKWEEAFVLVQYSAQRLAAIEATLGQVLKQPVPFFTTK